MSALTEEQRKEILDMLHFFPEKCCHSHGNRYQPKPGFDSYKKALAGKYAKEFHNERFNISCPEGCNFQSALAETMIKMVDEVLELVG